MQWQQPAAREERGGGGVNGERGEACADLKSIVMHKGISPPTPSGFKVETDPDAVAAACGKRGGGGSVIKDSGQWGGHKPCWGWKLRLMQRWQPAAREEGGGDSKAKHVQIFS